MRTKSNLAAACEMTQEQYEAALEAERVETQCLRAENDKFFPERLRRKCFPWRYVEEKPEPVESERERSERQRQAFLAKYIADGSVPF